MSLHFGTAQLTMTVLQSLHMALFLHNFGSTALPWYFLAKGVGLLVISLFYSLRVVGRVSRQRETLGFLGVLLAVLLLARLLINTSAPWVYLSLSVFSEVFVSMFTLQCWGLFSDCLNSRQSKRLMPLIGAAGTLGAIFGGLLSSLLASRLGSENLLLVCLLFGACLVVISARLLTHHVQDTPSVSETEPPVESFWHAGKAILQQIFSHRLLLQFMLVLLSVRLAVNLSEYQQQILLLQHFDKDGITAFVGAYLAWINLLALLMQLLLENRLLQAWGPLTSLAITPLCICLGASGFMLAPGLISNTLGRGAEQLTQKSVYKTAVNLIYLAFPSELRRRLRMVINGLLEFFAVLPFVLVTAVFPRLPLVAYSAVACLAGLSALLLVWRLRLPYQQQLQAALQRRPLRQFQDDELYSSHSYSQLVARNLDAADDGLVLFSLALIQERPVEVAPEQLTLFFQHSHPLVREQAVRALARCGSAVQNPELLGLLARETEASIRQAVLKTLRHWATETDNPALLIYADDPDLGVQAESLITLFSCGGIAGILTAAARLKLLLQSDETPALQSAAYIMGEIGSGYFRQDFGPLLKDARIPVRQAACAAAGRSPDLAWLPDLLTSLSQPALVQAARQSLQRYAPADVIPALQQWLETHPNLRSEGVRVLEGFAVPASQRLLENWLPHTPWSHQAPLLRALGQLRRAGLELDPQCLYSATQLLLRTAYACLDLLWHLEQALPQASPRLSLLQAEVNGELLQLQRLLFQLLALRFDADLIQQAALNYASGEPHFRSLSLDLLTQYLTRSLGPAILQWLDDTPLSQKRSFGQEQAWIPTENAHPWYRHPLLRSSAQLERLTHWCQSTSPEENSVLDLVYQLKQTPLFANLSVSQLEPVAQVCQRQSRPPGHIMFQEGQPGDALYILCSGSVVVESHGIELARLYTRDVFGEVEVLNSAPRLATIRCLDTCELLTISRQDFTDLLEDHPGFAKSLVEILFQRLRAAFERADKARREAAQTGSLNRPVA
ncbi:MAG: MFS transporter [Candidatus Sericytochromatia bacterium]